MSNQSFYGSIDLTLLIEQAKAKHSAFSKSTKNDHVYANVTVWLNEEKDKYGNIMSIQINPTKEMKDLDKKIYIGNMKQSEGSKPIGDRDVSGLDTDFDVPERQAGTPATGAAPNANNPADDSSDLPF